VSIQSFDKSITSLVITPVQSQAETVFSFLKSSFTCSHVFDILFISSIICRNHKNDFKPIDNKSNEKLTKKLNFLSVKQRVTYNTIMLFHKMKKGLLPNSLNRVRNSHSHNTRSWDDFISPNFRKTSTQNSLLYNGMKIYNNIRRLDEFQNIRTMNDFQKICLCSVKMNF
jgi:hypothetical protein